MYILYTFPCALLSGPQQPYRHIVDRGAASVVESKVRHRISDSDWRLHANNLRPLTTRYP